MKTVSHRQSHANTESYDSAIATPKPPSLRDPHHEQPQPQTYDLSHVDLFSHDPGPRSVSNSRSVPNIVQANPQVEPVPALVQRQESEPEEAVQSDSEAHETSMAPPLQPPSEPGPTKGDSIQPQRLPAFNPSKGFAHLDLFSHAPRRDPIQMKLTVGEPGDRYEQEADRMADQVMRMAAPTAPPVQRQAEEEQAEIQAASLVEAITPVVQRQGNATEDPVQAKCETCEAAAPVQRVLWQASPKPTDPVQAQPDLERQLNASKGSGSPLSAEVRSFMEPRFGADFSQVRVHTNSEAVQMNRDLNAQAFTHKQDVYFGGGKASGKDALTAHELTHVVQQTGALQRELIQRDGDDNKLVDFDHELELPIELKDKKGQTVFTQAAELTLSFNMQALYTAKSSKFKFSLGKLKLATVVSAASEMDGGVASTNTEAAVSVGASATIFSARITRPSLFLPAGSELKLGGAWSGTFNSDGSYESKTKPKLVFIIPITKGQYEKSLEVEATPGGGMFKFTGTF